MKLFKNIKTIRDLISASISAYPKQNALSFVNQTPITYEELGDKIDMVSYYLSQNGIGKGDKVAIFSENSPHWGVAYLTVTYMASVVVPILPDFSSSEVETIVTHSDTKVIFVSEKLYKVLPEKIRNSTIKIILLKDFNIIPQSVSEKDLKTNCSNTIERETSTQTTNYKTFKHADVDENDITSIIYTSGTTGTSKGVMLSHKNLITNTIAASKIQHIDTSSRFMSILPLSHTYENTIGFLYPMMCGSTVYYLSQPPTPSVLMPALKSVQPSIMLTVPLIIEKIYRVKILKTFTQNSIIKTIYKFPPTRKLLNRMAGKKLIETFGGKLVFFGIGGAPLAPDVEKFLIEAKFPYSVGYGLTETSPLLAGSAPADAVYRSTGPAIDGVTLKIDNPDKNGEGEILAKGPNVMKGYYKNSELTKTVFTEDGWFKTGDLGLFDKNNNLMIRGRLKNMILGPGGENVYPEEIEASLNKYRFIQESLVFEEKGKIVAKVQFNFEELEQHLKQIHKSAHNIQKRALDEINVIKQHINSELNKFSRLNVIIIQVEPFEKTPTQKIKRFLYTKI